MLSHTCFFGALLIYYIPRMMNKKSKFLRNTSYCIRIISYFRNAWGDHHEIWNTKFHEVFMFSAVMLFIGITGYLMTKAKNMRRWHIIATLSFFAYLALIIIL